MESTISSTGSHEDKLFSNLEIDNDSLDGIEFFSCKFIKSSFQYASFSNCLFENCLFEQCNLSLADIAQSKFVATEFDKSKLTGINWSHVKGIFSVHFNACLLNDNIFTGMKLAKFTFKDCDLHDALFTNTNLKHALFSNCDLQGCQFENTDLSFSDFSTSKNYFIDAKSNKLYKTKFSLPEAASLLKNFNIILT